VPRYVEHPTHAGAWRRGGYEVLPEAETATHTVWFAVEPGEDDDTVWEGLRAHVPETGRAVIAAVPVFAYDVDLGDEVEVVASSEGPLVGVRVLRDSGRFTFRVSLNGRQPSPDGWHGLQRELEPYGCWFDVWSPTLIAISADAAVARAVADHLYAQQLAGRFIYETGHQSKPGAL
jgi:hypothetical protein